MNEYMMVVRNIILCLFVLLGAYSCGEMDDQKESVPEHTVEVTAEDFTFDAPTEIASGWHTFKFVNAGHAPHFFFLSRLPDSIEYKRYLKEIVRPFETVMDSLQAGMSMADGGALLGSLIPSWYFAGVRPMGGTGIVDTGMNAWVSMKLDPGSYVMECYIKEKGVFHTTLGMIRPIEVSSDTTSMSEPKADLSLTLRNFEISQEGEAQEGWNRVAVHFEEHPEVGLGNDVHVIRRTGETDLQEVGRWMNWMEIGGLEPPAPVKFLGGTQEMGTGTTAYFHIKLEAGTYAWLSESAAARGMVKEFEVKGKE